MCLSRVRMFSERFSLPKNLWLSGIERSRSCRIHLRTKKNIREYIGNIRAMTGKPIASMIMSLYSASLHLFSKESSATHREISNVYTMTSLKCEWIRYSWLLSGASTMMYRSNASVRIYSRQMLAWTYTAKCRPCSTNYMIHESEKNTATVRLEYPRSGHIHEVVWNR